MQYRSEIDGLRAIAVIAVILYHFGIIGFDGGYLGVDVFFVISGYLIAAIILHDLSEDRFSFADFFERRARRILPALYFVMFTSIPMAIVWLSRTDLMDFMQSLAAAAGFGSNLFFWLKSGYFEIDAEMKPLLHTWSLAVEGQYYVIFPLLMLPLCRKSKQAAAGVFAIIAAASLALAHWSSANYPEAAFYLLPTRLWELLLGALCAFWLHGRNSPPVALCHPLGLLGLAMVIAPMLLFDETTPTPSLYTLIPTTGAALIVLFCQRQSLAGMLLSLQPMVWIGLISYSLYLWHFPLVVFLKHITLGTYGALELTIVLVVTVILSILTYRYVETPFRRHQLPSRKEALSMFAAIPTALIVGASYGFLDDVSLQKSTNEASQKYEEAMRDWAFPRGLMNGPYKLSHVSHSRFDPEVMFMGDSHAQQYGPLVTHMAQEGTLKPTMMFTGGGCAPIPNVYENKHWYCRDFIERFEAILDENPTIQTLVIAGCFNCYFIENTKAWSTSHHYYYEDEDGKAYFKRGQGRDKAIKAFRNYIAALSERIEVIVILDNPYSNQFDPRVALKSIDGSSSSHFAKKYPNYTPYNFPQLAPQRALTQELKTALSTLDISIIDPAPIVCPNNRCNASDATGKPIYKDEHHMRPFFVRSQFDELAAFMLKKQP